MMMTKPTTSLPMNPQNVRQKNNPTSLLATRSIEVKTNNTLSINVSEQTTMNMSCLLMNPSVRWRRKSCNRQSQLWTSSVAPLVFPVILLLCLGSFDQGSRTKSPCYQVHAWLPPSPRQQPWRSPRQRTRPLLKLFAYTEETGPRVGGAGYPNQTQPLTSTTALWNGKSQPTPSLSQVSVQQPLSKPDVGTLGDIMSSAPSSLGDEEGEEPVFSSLPASLFHHSGLVTSSSRNETLAAKFGITHPLDRMALTANGNLQRLFSSYYDAPVFVHVDYCQARDDKGIVWDRVVHLNVHNKTFCTATSVITVNDDTCRQLVQSGQVGLGQLFRYLDLLPQFELQQAGRHANNNGGWWRVYELKCRQVTCHIREDFCAHLWDIEPR